MFRRIEEGTTTVRDSQRLKEIIFGIILIALAVGIAVGFFLA